MSASRSGATTADEEGAGAEDRGDRGGLWRDGARGAKRVDGTDSTVGDVGDAGRESDRVSLNNQELARAARSEHAEADRGADEAVTDDAAEQIAVIEGRGDGAL